MDLNPLTKSSMLHLLLKCKECCPQDLPFSWTNYRCIQQALDVCGQQQMYMANSRFLWTATDVYGKQ